MKITKQKENIKYIGYMGKIEESEMNKIESDLPMELYLYKSSKFYMIYEKETGSALSSPAKTQKEAIQKVNDYIEKFGVERLLESKHNLLNKNGYINSYDVGEWLKSKSI